MKIVAIGGNGFIGSHFVAEAVDRGHEVVVCGLSTQPRLDHGRPFTMLLGGIRALIENIGEYADADIICHFASSTIPASSNADPVRDIQENLVANVRLFEAMRSTSCKRILYLSSGGAIYGTPQYTPIDEDHPQNPISSYGIVKGAAERYLGMFAKTYGLRPAIVRPANPYGPGQDPKGQLGVISTFIDRANRGEPVTIFGDGSIVRDFVYVTDLAALLLKIIEQDATGTYNCGSGSGVSLIDLVGEITRVGGRPLEVRHEKARNFDPHSVVLDISRAKQQLGWKPRVPLAEGIRRTWEGLAAAQGAVDA